MLKLLEIYHKSEERNNLCNYNAGFTASRLHLMNLAVETIGVEATRSAYRAQVYNVQHSYRASS